MTKKDRKQKTTQRILETKLFCRPRRIKEIYLHKQGKETEDDNQIKRTVTFFNVIIEMKGIFLAKISMITDKAKFYWKRRNKEELINI